MYRRREVEDKLGAFGVRAPEAKWWCPRRGSRAWPSLQSTCSMAVTSTVAIVLEARDNASRVLQEVRGELALFGPLQAPGVGVVPRRARNGPGA